MTIYPEISRGLPIVYGIRLLNDPTFEYRYVGLTTIGTERFRKHISNARNPTSVVYLYPKSLWIRKHYYNVVFDILEEAESKELLPLVEMKWVYILRERGHRLLNLTDGGEGTFGKKLTPEHRKKISLANAGTKNPNYGNTHTAEARAKIAAANKGNKYSVGRRHTEETKRAMSRVRKGVTLSEEHRAKISEAGKGRKHTSTTKDKQSKSKMGDKNPNFGKVGTMAGKHHNAETKVRISFSRHSRSHTEKIKETCRWCLGADLQTEIDKAIDDESKANDMG